jgi:opacity protein-like surface antigen
MSLALAAASPAWGYDPVEEFQKGTKVFSVEAGGGAQNNVENHKRLSDISFVFLTPRLSVLPLDPVGSGILRGSLETGIEPWFQYYLEPETATAEGMKIAVRYHFLSGSPIFPYVEATVGAAGTSLNVKEIRSDFTVVMEAGVGLSYFIDDGVALTAGYRFQHISNGNVQSPNRGFNSDAGLIGISIFFR